MAEFNYSKNSNKLSIVFSEKRLDYNTAVKLSDSIKSEVDRILKEEEGKPTIVFDLRNVEYVSSMFIRTVLLLVNKVGKENLQIANANIFVYNLFNETGLSSLMA